MEEIPLKVTFANLRLKLFCHKLVVKNRRPLAASARRVRASQMRHTPSTLDYQFETQMQHFGNSAVHVVKGILCFLV